MNKVIICCSCGGVPTRARAAGERFGSPPLYSGQNSLLTLAERLSGEIAEFVRAYAKNKEKFAYYLEWDDDNYVKMQYNLLKGE